VREVVLWPLVLFMIVGVPQIVGLAATARRPRSTWETWPVAAEAAFGVLSAVAFALGSLQAARTHARCGQWMVGWGVMMFVGVPFHALVGSFCGFLFHWRGRREPGASR
jgi:hypothetical protein